MTSRLRDVLPLTVGSYLVLLGLLFLVDALGIRSIGAAGLVEGAFGLAFIALGILSVLAAIRVRRVSRQLRRAFGHVRSAGGWSVDDAVIQTVLGDIHLDLRNADLPEGETELTLLCWLGTIDVHAPPDLGLDVSAQTIIGSVDVLGRREEGFVRDIRVRTHDYDRRTRRLRMRLSAAIGELTVVQHNAGSMQR